MVTELIHIGFGNMVAMNRVIAMSSPSSAPTRRAIQEGRSNGKLIDMTNGRRTKAVIFTDTQHIILAALTPDTIANRMQVGRVEPVSKPEQSYEKVEMQ